MPSIGPRFPGTAASLANAGTSENANAWTSPTNVGADDGSEASITAATYDSPDISELLVASNFGFDVPLDATVTGITVEIERRDQAIGAASDNRVQLAKGTTFASLVGANKADTALDWPTAVAVKTYGSSTDLWSTTWAPSEINASSFAVMLSVQADAANTDIFVDFIRVTVEYINGPTYIGSGRSTAPGQPHEWARRRLPFPAQEFTNTQTEAPTSETPVFGGATAAGVTPVAVVAVSAGGATAAGTEPTERYFETPTFGGATSGGNAPTAVVTEAAQGATAQGTSPAPTVPVNAPPVPPSFIDEDHNLSTGASQLLTAAHVVDQGAVGDLLIYAVIQDGVGAGGFVQGTGLRLEDLDGTDGDITVLGPFDVGSPATAKLSIGLARVTDPASPGPQIRYTGDGSDDFWYQIISFRGIDADADAIENGATTHASAAGTGATIDDVAVVTEGYQRLAINVIALDDHFDLVAFTGETGGDWAEVVEEYQGPFGTDATVGYQSAVIALPGTIDGGSQTMSGSAGWAVVGFALKPADPTGPAGGATAGGIGPVAVVALTSQGAIAGGNAPSDGAAVTETPEFGGATAAGVGPTAVVSVETAGALAAGVSPTASVSVTAQGATGQGNTPAPTVAVTPGGATGQGATPAPTVTVTAGGATGQGNTPSTAEAVTPGGALAQGAGPGATVPPQSGGAGGTGSGPGALTTLTSQGAVAGGNEPTDEETVEETPEFGGATSGGFEPTAVVGVAVGGATGQGNGPGAAETAGSGGATAAGVTPTAYVTVAVGGATGQGNPPGTTETAGSGGAIGSGNAATAVVGVTPGGATSGGNEPSAPLSETPVFGGATAAGQAPSASVTSATGGASANGSGPNPSSTPTPGGATANGNESSSSSSATAGGAVAGGRESTPAASVDFGGSSTGSGSTSAVVGVTPGGAITGGNQPIAPLSETPIFGGATAGGNAATPAASVDQGGVSTGGGTTTAYVPLSPGGALAGGRTPVEIGVTPPTPAGPTPGSGVSRRVKIHRDHIEYLDRERAEELTEDEEEALLLLSLSLE